MAAYYNEFDPVAAAWLRELIRNGHIADGVVDERSIEDVEPADVAGFTQCHFFAGIGVWSYALRRAGWPDERPVWTGSCPCQPFSAAGKGTGFADERHLWPAFHHLISQCEPAVVLGEQVASKDGLAWLDLVQTDLEATGYASGAVDLCAAGVGAPHIRQRLWWVAERLADTYDAGSQGRVRVLERADQRAAGPRGVEGGLADASNDGWKQGWDGSDLRWVHQAQGKACGERGERAVSSECSSERSGMADAADCGREPFTWHSGVCVSDDGKGSAAEQSGAPRSSGGLADTECRQRGEVGLFGLRKADGTESSRQTTEPSGSGDGCGLADADSGGREPWQRDDQTTRHGHSASAACDADRQGAASPTNGLWRDADWLFCRDGKWRPVEPGTFPLAHGAPARVGRLRGYGNAIVAPAAQAFIEAVM